MKKCDTLLLCLVFQFFISGCMSQKNDGVDIVIEKIPDTFNLKGYPINDTFFKELKDRPRLIGLIDTLLVFIDQARGNQSLEFYSLRDFSFVASYGKKEIDSSLYLSNPYYFNQFWKKSDSTLFLLADMKTNVLKQFNLTKILNNNKTTPDWTLRLPSDLIFRFNTIYMQNNSLLLGDYRPSSNDYNLKGKYFIFNPKSREINWKDMFSASDNELPSNVIPYYYYSYLAYNASLGVTVSAMHYFNKINILNENGEKLKSISMSNSKNLSTPKIDKTTESIDTSSIVYFNDVFASTKYFYAISIENTINYYLSDVGKMKLYVFDWNFTPKTIIYLDRVFLGKFIVDEKSNELIIVNYGKDSERYPLIKYKLPINL